MPHTACGEGAEQVTGACDVRFKSQRELNDTDLRRPLSQLPRHEPTPISLQPDGQWLAQATEALALLGLRKVRLEGQIAPDDRAAGWRLTAQLGATVVQPCVRSLAPVRTRLELPVLRRYLKDLPSAEAEEAEIPEDDSLEPLVARIDLGALMLEEISLALPAFPRADDAEPATHAVQAAPPGVTPLSGDDLKPFAALQALREGLENGPKDED